MRKHPRRCITPKLNLVCFEDRITPTVVNTTLDIVDPADGKTSLREAVTAFNAASDDFQATSISFDNAVKGATFTLTAGELVVTASAGAVNKLLSINNNDTTAITISGNNASRIINVSAGSELQVSGNFVL